MTIEKCPYPIPPRVDMLTILVAKANHYLFGMDIYPTRWLCWGCLTGGADIVGIPDDALRLPMIETRIESIQTGQISGWGSLRPIYFIKPRMRVKACAECKRKRSKRRRHGITPPLSPRPFILPPILPPGADPKRYV